MAVERVFRFFAGKGGVGKTTCAAAWALGRARGGRRVLVASTDPAHSLGDALDAALGGQPVEVDVGGGRHLLAVEVAGPGAYRRWLEERREAFLAIAERGSLLDRGQAERLLALPMPGVDELVGLIEVVRVAAAAGCEEVVVDTAPTGHTLRLLESPEALRRLAALLAAVDERHRVLAATFGGGAAGEAEAVLARLEEEARFLGELLRDPERSAFCWVSLPEALAVEEARGAFAALARQGVPLAEVVVDRWPPAADGGRRQDGAAAVAALAALAPGVPFRAVPELAAEPRGPAALRQVAAALAAPARSGEEMAAAAAAEVAAEVLDEVADDRRSAGPARAAGVEGEEATGRDGLSTVPARVGAARAAEAAGAGGGEGEAASGAAPAGDAGEAPAWLGELAPPGLSLLFVGGKGGVGKTTCAATIALWAAAARPGRPVRLVSVDPAHSLGDVLRQPLADEPRAVAGAAGDLLAREVDAPAAWEVLRQRLGGEVERLLAWGDQRAGGAATVDREVVRRLLESPPPGLNELVALVEIAEAAGRAGSAPRGAVDPPLVVVDTAPTGHALRLLEMPELALSWVQALMAILLDLREALGLGAVAEELVALSRRLRAFRALRGDPRRCRFLLVTRGGELPRRESERLLAALDRLGVAPAGVVLAAAPPGASLALPAAVPAAAGGLLVAPAVSPPPRGGDALLAWGRAWRPWPQPAP